MTPEKFNHWGLLELFGHVRIAGLISEQTVGGSSFIRIDVPATGDLPEFTRLIGPSAIYAINPLDEATARMMVNNIKAQPITAYDLRANIEKLVDKRVALAASNATLELEDGDGDADQLD